MRINEVVDVPDELGECSSLVELDLSNNEIPALPESLSALKELAMLRVGANCLEALPLRLCLDFQGLQELQLFGNPLPNVPSSMNVRGNAECTRLLGLLENLFRREELLHGSVGEATPEKKAAAEEAPLKPQDGAGGGSGKPRPSRPTRRKPAAAAA